MKQINQYIQESILDDEDDIMQNDDIIADQWLKENYKINGTYTITNKLINVNGRIQVQNKNITQLLPEGYKFGVVKGYFDCSSCKLLTSLNGAPKKVSGAFLCYNCSKLINLEGGPEIVTNGVYSCTQCKSLISTKGGPKQAKTFDCSSCTNLKKFEDLPQILKDTFMCIGCTSLTSLKGCPEIINGSFYCNGCINLNTLKDGPKEVKKQYHCSSKFTKSDVQKYTKVGTEIYNI